MFYEGIFSKQLVCMLNKNNTKHFAITCIRMNFDIFLNAKLFVSNTNVEKFNSFDYGLEVLSDSILIKEINEEVFS